MAVDRARRRRTGLLGAPVLTMVLVSCGGGGNKAASNTTTTPAVTLPAGLACEVITKAEVEAVIGARVANAQPSGGGSTAACKYEVEGTPQSVIVAVSAPTDPQDFQNAKATADRAQPVPGAVDGFAADGRAYVLKGTTLAIVAVSLERPVAARTEAARRLAQAAAGRI